MVVESAVARDCPAGGTVQPREPGPSLPGENLADFKAVTYSTRVIDAEFLFRCTDSTARYGDPVALLTFGGLILSDVGSVTAIRHSIRGSYAISAPRNRTRFLRPVG
jgi:hypothetical protein